MKPYTTKPALSGILSVVLPTREETLLLRACLWPGDPGRRAWEEWRRCVGNPIELLRDGNERLKALLPLIHFALQRNGVSVEEALKTCLYMSSLREELRYNAYRRILARVISFYAEKEIPAIVLRGAALADTVYESPASRHSGKIQILIGGDGSFPDENSLIPPRFRRLQEGFSRGRSVMTLKHDSGLPLHLHRRLFPATYYHIPFDRLWGRSRIRQVAGQTARTLASADNLLHVCGEAFFNRSSRSLLWVFDSLFLINRSDAIDWDELLETARDSHLELPLSVMLGYLSEKMNAPVPVPFINGLYNSASAAEARGRAYALSVAREGFKGNYVKMFIRGEDWKERFYLLIWVLYSPVSHLKWLKRNFRPGQFLSRYILRPVRNLIGRQSDSLIEAAENNKSLSDD
jgi:hypothetical protein